MAYSPKYVSRSDIPVQIPDNYNERDKNAALELAETSLELDLNDGDEISDEDVSSMMRVAVKQKATCELAKSADDPNSTKFGDITDSGTNKQDYAKMFCDRYDEIVMKILESGALADEGGEDESPYVYTTMEPNND
jgi:hypothetical protein